MGTHREAPHMNTPREAPLMSTHRKAPHMGTHKEAPHMNTPREAPHMGTHREAAETHKWQLTNMSTSNTSSVSFRVYARTKHMFRWALEAMEAHVCLLVCSVTRLSTTLKANLHHESGLSDK